MQADSPTSSKDTLHMLLAVAVTKQWQIKGGDIKNTYIQKSICGTTPREEKEKHNLETEEKCLWYEWCWTLLVLQGWGHFGQAGVSVVQAGPLPFLLLQWGAAQGRDGAGIFGQGPFWLQFIICSRYFFQFFQVVSNFFKTFPIFSICFYLLLYISI